MPELTPIVGPLIGQLTVETAVAQQLDKWLPTHAVAAARRYAAQGVYGLTSPAMEDHLANYRLAFRPKQITVSHGFTQWLIDSLPHVQIWSPSWTRISGNEEGMIATFQIQIAYLVGALDQDDTRLLRAIYEDAVLGVIDQHRAYDLLPEASIQVNGAGAAELTDLSTEDTRTFSGGVLACEITVPRIVDWRRAPVATDPLADDVNQVPPVWPYDPTLPDGGASIDLQPQPPAYTNLT